MSYNMSCQNYTCLRRKKAIHRYLILEDVISALPPVSYCVGQMSCQLGPLLSTLRKRLAEDQRIAAITVVRPLCCSLQWLLLIIWNQREKQYIILIKGLSECLFNVASRKTVVQSVKLIILRRTLIYLVNNVFCMPFFLLSHSQLYCPAQMIRQP